MLRKKITAFLLILSSFNANAINLEFSNKFEEIFFESKQKKIIENLNKEEIPNYYHQYIINDSEYIYYYLKHYNNEESLKKITKEVMINTMCVIINIPEKNENLLKYNIDTITEGSEENFMKLEKAYMILDKYRPSIPTEEEIRKYCLIFDDSIEGSEDA